MAGKSKIKNPVKKVLDVVRKEVVAPGSPDRTSAANFRGLQGGNGTGPAAETEITREGEVGGEVVTFYTAMTELDSTESAVAFTGTEI